MKRQLDTALAAALLLCLATAGQAAARPSPAEDEPGETVAYEYEDQASMDGGDAEEFDAEVEREDDLAADESYADGSEVDGEASPDEVANSADEDHDTTASDSGESTSDQVKGGLKRMLIGLLLPAVEREVRKAVGSDENAQANADAEPEAGSDP